MKMTGLRQNAAITSAIRRKIAQTDKPIAVFTLRHTVSDYVVQQWKKRDSFEDRSYTAYRLQTTLTPAEEIAVDELRRMLSLPLGSPAGNNPEVFQSGCFSFRTLTMPSTR